MPEMYLYRCSQDVILETMERYGGSFVQQLARLFRLGDERNRQRLAETFSDYFQQYDKMTDHIKARRIHFEVPRDVPGSRSEDQG